MTGAGIYIGPAVAIGAGLVICAALAIEHLISRHRERAEMRAQALLDQLDTGIDREEYEAASFFRVDPAAFTTEEWQHLHRVMAADKAELAAEQARGQYRRGRF